MTDAINNETNIQADKPAPAPQPMPEQKTSAPADSAEIKAVPASPILPDLPANNPLAETKIKTTMPAQNADTASVESAEGDTSTCRLQSPDRFQPAADEPKEKTKESPVPATEQAIKQAENIQEKNKTEQKISENNIQKTDKELPHQKDNLVPFEIVEPEQEPPEKLGLKDAISTLPENEKHETNISNAPKSAITTMPESAPAQPAGKSAKDDFANQFRNKLKQLLGIANQKRQDKAQANLDKIIKYAKEKQKITNNDVERLADLSDRQALRYLKKLTKQNKLIKFGKKKNTFYKPINK